MPREQAYKYADVVDEQGLMPWVPIGARVRLPSGHVLVISEADKKPSKPKKAKK